VALVWRVFGEQAAVFQAINLAELVLLGHLTYQLGKRVLPDFGVAFLASVLVLGSASFYEATHWLLLGNMHLLGDDLYVLAVILAYDIARGRLPRAGPWLLGGTVLAAVFSHPAMTPVVPVCALTLFLVSRDRASEQPAARETRWKRALVPLVVVVALFATARILFDAYLVGVPQPGIDAWRLFWLVRRLIALFTLQGSTVVVDRLMTFGSFPAFGTSAMSFFVGAWIAAAVMAAAALCLRPARGNGVRLLIGFLAIHLAALTLASPLTPRQMALPAVPAALLTAWAIHTVAERLAGRASDGAALYRAVPAASVILLVVAAQPDQRTAADLFMSATAASRALVERIRAVAPSGGPPVDLMLINMPDVMADRGLSAFAFQNGLPELARLTSDAVGTVELRQMPGLGSTDQVSAQIRTLGPDALRSQLADPYRVLLVFEPERLGVRTVTAKDLEGYAGP
jgi:hypothetical protein